LPERVLSLSVAVKALSLSIIFVLIQFNNFLLSLSLPKLTYKKYKKNIFLTERIYKKKVVCVFLFRLELQFVKLTVSTPDLRQVCQMPIHALS
jgi:hypothetical protein